ncbi:hypothetical protein ACHAXA_005888 [Cyclostephanos tholiformis]|uniref:Quercetin 2,3-dioxygenase C-terminal cupin domain-containing protein n=1 Tax=Cyclostephanos tholiformis TaxID=382380 RepID=A0ABD3SCR1_9STRA
MTAGRGVRHSEFNLEKEKGLRFIQSWIVPRREGFVPRYGSFDPAHYGGVKRGSEDAFTARNKWRHLVSDTQDESNDALIRIEQDANMFVIEMDADQTVDFLIKDDRMAYILCVEGSVKLTCAESGNEVILQRHDGCEITPGGSDNTTLAFNAIGSEEVEGSEIAAHVLMFEMALVDGSGRSDF